MAQVPEIVALRLRQAEAQSAHPDADRLAALVEQSLSPEKREATLLHLSACATCRDVVALMAIASPVSAPVEAVHGSSNWSRFSPFRALPVRWAAVAAGVAVVMSTVWIGYEHKPANAPVQVAVVRPAPEPTAERQQAELLPSQPGPATGSVEKSKSSQVVRPTPTKTQGQRDGDPAARVFSMAAAARAAGEDMQKGSEAAADSNVANTQVARLGVHPRSAWQTGISERGSVGGRTTTKVAVGQKLLWMVTPAGRLQSSSDNGVTWQVVDLNVGVGFTTVDAVGASVWVSGHGGVLYHSADSGRQWLPVTIATGDNTLKGEISSIKFSDSYRGVIVTQSGVKWMTSDGGHTWAIQ